MAGQVEPEGGRPAATPAGWARPPGPGSTPCTSWRRWAGAGLLAVHAFLFAAATDGELDAAAQAHEAQARQLRDPHVRAALRGAWPVVDPLRLTPGHGRPDAPLADLLALAPPELAAAVRAELAAAGLDPDATGWPPPADPLVG